MLSRRLISQGFAARRHLVSHGKGARTMRRGSWRSVLKVVIALTSTAVFLHLAIRGVDLGALGQVIWRTNWAVLLVAAAVSLGTYSIRALRWKVILGPVKGVGFHSAFVATVIGFMANNVLPLRVGEFVKAFVVVKRENLPMSSILATIVIERVFDGMAVAMISLGVVFVPGVPLWIRQAALGLLVGFVLLLVGLTVLALYKDRLLTRVSGWPGVQGELGRRVEEIAAGFSHGIVILRDVRSAIIVAMFSVGLWLAHAAVFYLILVSLDMRLPLYAALVVLVCTSVGVLLPSGPGYVGTFQYFSMLALAPFTVPQEIALGYSLVAHAAQWAPVTALGLGYAWILGLGIREVTA